ncbi:MBL fold metallo-hydrolase [Candidatus Geothermarchaeota archaeon]|nr:MAG: MBL fold metallo-hydrolase [Candidatus Geothermarchaeota archaeon]
MIFRRIGNPHRQLILALIIVVLTLTTITGVYFSQIREIKEVYLKSVDYAEVLILIDNNRNNENLKAPWGISILVRTPFNIVLFDVGPDPADLKYNSKILGIDLALIDFVVISHEHWDHIGGLRYFAELKKRIAVYVPAHMSLTSKSWIRKMNFSLIEVDRTTTLAPGVAIIGEVYGPPYEQALAVNVRNLGLIIIVGCSHPGVEKFVEKAVEDFNLRPYAVIGGFHLTGASINKLNDTIKKLIDLGVRRIFPIHCSGERIRDLLRTKWSEYYGDGHVGLKLMFKKLNSPVSGKADSN